MLVIRRLRIIGIYLDLTTHLVAVERASMSTFVGCTCTIMHSGRGDEAVCAGLDAGLGRASKARAGTIRTRSQSAC